MAKEVDQPKASISGKFSTDNLILVIFISTLVETCNRNRMTQQNNKYEVGHFRP